MKNLNVLTDGPIDLNTIIATTDSPETGGMVIFSGIVRNNSKGRSVSYLIYEAYKSMAEKTIREIVAHAVTQWNLTSAVCIHRLGRLEIGECAILVVTCSSHRSGAYEANRYIIDKVKSDVPIWKNEYFTDGTSEWGKNG